MSILIRGRSKFWYIQFQFKDKKRTGPGSGRGA